MRRSLLMFWLLAMALTPPAARAASPAQLLATDASGMVEVKAACPSGPQLGSGFLLGPRLVMTARHVLVDRKARSCTAKVVQQGTGRTVAVARWMALRVAKSKAPTDLALMVLASPLSGYQFSISSVSPKPGARVVALGYALAQPLSLNQGHVLKLTTEHGVRLLELRLLEAGGASGGPILDASGHVVGVNQFGTPGTLLAVDLAHLVEHHTGEFCVGVASGQTATVCAGADATGILEADAPPRTCSGLGLTSVLPFFACPKLPALTEDTSGVVAVESRCSTVGDWSGSVFMLGPQLMMTARSLLIDPATGKGCTSTVLPGLAAHPVRITGWVGVQRSDSRTSTDVALAELAVPVKSHYFTLSPTSPQPGQLVYALDYLATHPSSVNRGHVTNLVLSDGTPQLEMHVPVASGHGGGPIVDADGRVVGIAQTWDNDINAVYSVDLAQLTNGDPSQFCFALAAGSNSTICGTSQTQATLFGEDGSPQVCGTKAENPPFTYCAQPSQNPRTAPVTTGSTTPPSFNGCWATTVDSFDESQQASSVPDTNPKVYFVYRLNLIRIGTYIKITVTAPNGSRGDLAPRASVWITNPASVYWRSGPFFLSPSPAPDGRWTVTATLTNGPTTASCSYAINVTPPSP